MSNWIKKIRRKIGEIESSSEMSKFINTFRTVESIDHCIDLFFSEGLIDKFGLTHEKIIFLEKMCGHMRSIGLGLEPNLIGRTICKVIIDRHIVGAVAVRIAKVDTDFCAYILQADSARNRGDFPEAQYKYWCALELIPTHPNYRVQYGHCLKENKLLKEALIQYLDAYYFGALEKDVVLHAKFVANAVDRNAEVSAIFKRKPQQSVTMHDAMDCVITSNDAIILTKLLLGYTPSVDDIVRQMCECKNKRELFGLLIKDERFSRSHRGTLRLISETKWGEK